MCSSQACSTCVRGGRPKGLVVVSSESRLNSGPHPSCMREGDGEQQVSLEGKGIIYCTTSSLTPTCSPVESSPCSRVRPSEYR